MHLTASPFYGGPERQMLGLARELSDLCTSVFVSFLEEGRCWEFIREAESQGFTAHALRFDTPRVVAVVKELAALLRTHQADVLLTHGYKGAILGRIAARRVGIPVVAVSRGWNGESLRVRLFEFLDRINLRWMDHVVCVSHGQAEKVRRAGVREDKISVIHNAIRPERFDNPDPAYRDRLCRMFPQPPCLIVGSAGRLSPEKGFGVFIDAAAQVFRAQCSPHTPCAGIRHTACAGYNAADQLLGSPLAQNGRGAEGGAGGEGVGFILFGDGPLRDSLAQQIAARALEGKFILAGFSPDLDRYLPHLDLFVQSSFTEGLPNVILEAMAAQIPVVATAVGGTPETVEDGVTGCLVPAADPQTLADSILQLLPRPEVRRGMGLAGRERVASEFSFAAQADRYRQLLRTYLPNHGKSRELATQKPTN